MYVPLLVKDMYGREGLCIDMAYKPGDKLIPTNIFFRMAAFLTFYVVLFVASILVWGLYRCSFFGRKKLRQVGNAITVSNHTLLFDPVLIAMASFPTKPFQTLLEATVCAPFVGTLTRLLGGVPVPRRDIHLEFLKEGCLEAFRRKKKIHFYPEGECYLYNSNPRKFHTGAFFLSAVLDVPIIPVATVFHKRRCRPTVHLHVLDSVYPSDYNLCKGDGSIDQQALKEYAAAVRQKIADKIAEEQGTGIYYKGAMDRIPGINA